MNFSKDFPHERQLSNDKMRSQHYSPIANNETPKNIQFQNSMNNQISNIQLSNTLLMSSTMEMNSIQDVINNIPDNKGDDSNE